MKISPPLAAIVAALIVAAVVAFVLRPAQLSVHPAAEPTLVHTADPEHAVPLHARPRPLVYVAGAVVHPGVYDVAEDARARDAIAKAGGTTRDADTIAVNLAAHVADGDEIAVPHIGDPAVHAAPHRRPSGAHHPSRRRHRRPAAQSYAAGGESLADPAPLDLNSADAEELAQLPGIGPVLADRIVAFRALNGPFTSVDGLADVSGITPARLEELEREVSVR